MFVLQDGSFRLTVSRPVVYDYVEFGKSAKVLADCALVPVELASEVTDRRNALTMLIEMLNNGKATVSEDVSRILPAQDKHIRVPAGVEITRELVLLENSLSNATVRWTASVGIGL